MLANTTHIKLRLHQNQHLGQPSAHMDKTELCAQVLAIEIG